MRACGCGVGLPNAGGGKFPFFNVQFSKNHRPVPIERATLLPPSNERRQTHAHQNRQRYFVSLHSVDSKEEGKSLDALVRSRSESQSVAPTAPLARNSQKPRASTSSAASKNLTGPIWGYRVADNLFVASCKKTYFDQICRDDMLDFLYELRSRPSSETGQHIVESTVFNYFLKVMVFLNDRGIGKYVAREDWVQKKDWPVNECRLQGQETEETLPRLSRVVRHSAASAWR